jgi:fluoride exporter
VAPFVLMNKQAQPAEKSVLLTRPTNAFYGVYVAAKQRDMLQFITALVAILSEFLPILLSNIPYTLTQTLETHNACTYGSLIIMAAMVLLLAGSAFVRWPHLPVDPRTIAGAVYYVADSAMLRDMSGCGISTMERHERDQYLTGLGRSYFYGRVFDTSVHTRMVIDSVGGH